MMIPAAFHTLRKFLQDLLRRKQTLYPLVPDSIFCYAFSCQGVNCNKRNRKIYGVHGSVHRILRYVTEYECGRKTEPVGKEGEER